MIQVTQNLLLEILSMNQNKIKNFLQQFCNLNGNDFMAIYLDPDYPWLVAHIDIVYDWYKKTNNTIILTNHEYYWSPNGLGADDRAGVYALLYLYSQGLKANYLFTDYEEIGCQGAQSFCNVMHGKINPPFFIEIDRQGYQEYVCYNGDEDNEEFISVIGKYFNPNIGTSSDIKILGKTFNVCSVNLSAGYYYPHKEKQEFLVYSHLKYTIEKIPKIIQELGNKKYKLP